MTSRAHPHARSGIAVLSAVGVALAGGGGHTAAVALLPHCVSRARATYIVRKLLTLGAALFWIVSTGLMSVLTERKCHCSQTEMYLVGSQLVGSLLRYEPFFPTVATHESCNLGLVCVVWILWTASYELLLMETTLADLLFFGGLKTRPLDDENGHDENESTAGGEALQRLAAAEARADALERRKDELTQRVAAAAHLGAFDGYS